MMPLELAQSLRSPFSGNFTKSLNIRSMGISSTFQILFNRVTRTNEIRPLSFQVSGGMLSNPTAVPFFKVFSAFFTSAPVIGPVLMASGRTSLRSVWIRRWFVEKLLEVLPPAVKLVININQDCAILVFHGFTLTVSPSKEHFFGILHFLRVIYLCCLLRFPNNAVDSVSFFPPTAPLNFTVHLVVNMCCSHLLVSRPSNFYLSLEISSLLNRFPSFLFHPHVPLMLDPATNVFVRGGIYALYLRPDLGYVMIRSVRIHMASCRLDEDNTTKSWFLSLTVQHLYYVYLTTLTASNLILTRWQDVDQTLHLRYVSRGYRSCSELLHFLLMPTWSISFSVTPMGDLHVI